MIIASSIVGTFIVTALIISPFSLHASVEHSWPIVKAHDPVHQETIESIAQLIGRSAEVMAVHPRGRTPYTEIVLWLIDTGEDGITEQEVAVISHSEILQTVTMYVLANKPEPDASRKMIFADESRVRERLGNPSFCDLWRGDPSVTARIIVTGVSDMKMTIVERLDAEWVRLWIELTWGTDSSDEMDVASTFVHAVARE